MELELLQKLIRTRLQDELYQDLEHMISQRGQDSIRLLPMVLDLNQEIT